MSGTTSPVNSVDLDRCPSLFRPSAHRTVNPYHAATVIDHHVATRATSPFEERELHLILHDGEEAQAPYTGRGRSAHTSVPAEDRPIAVPAYRPYNTAVGSEVEYFTDILREKLSKALTADKKKSAPTPAKSAPPRSHTPPPPPPPATSASLPAGGAASGSEALMAGMGHLMAAVGDIISSTRYPSAAAAPGGVLPVGAVTSAPYYYNPVGPPPMLAVAPPGWIPAPLPVSSPSAPGVDLFAKPPPRRAPIPFDLAGVCLDPSQHISGNFLQHAAGSPGRANGKSRSKPGKSRSGRTLTSDELLQGINFAPIGAPPVQSRSEMMDVILQKLQAIDQSEREIQQFLQRNTHSAKGVPFYPSNTKRPLPSPPSQEEILRNPEKLLERAAQVLAGYDPEYSDGDDEDNEDTTKQHKKKHDDGVQYVPASSDLQTYLSLPPQPKVTGVLHHDAYDATVRGVDSALIEKVAAKSMLPKGLAGNAKVNGEVKVQRDPQKEVEYLSKFPTLRADVNMTDEVFKFMKDLDL